MRHEHIVNPEILERQNIRRFMYQINSSSFWIKKSVMYPNIFIFFISLLSYYIIG